MSAVFSAFTLAYSLFEIPSALGQSRWIGRTRGRVAVDRWQSWTVPFYITGLVYAGGAFAWLAIDPTRPISQMSD